ncbi:hypothetical protein COCNU_scaffold044201G000010 [Cocos nucifera]|nr:hypothetical protein [Cocos nucifera]
MFTEGARMMAFSTMRASVTSPPPAAGKDSVNRLQHVVRFPDKDFQVLNS